MPTTPVFALPYPVASDTADVPRDIQALAVKLDGLALVPPVVTALPGSPVDGQEVYYQADAAAGVFWHLRYRSGATGSYKWEFVGGSPLAVESLAISSVVSMPVNTWGVQTTQLNVTLPLAGDYDVLHVGNWRNNTNVGSIGLGERFGSGGPDPAVGEYAFQAMPSAGAWGAITHRRRISGRPAAMVLTEIFQSAAGAVADIARQGGRIEVMPVRVG
jgi:hypothetical protein